MLARIIARVVKSSRRYKKSESGATAVEFALVAFPFFALLGVILETGAMMFTEFGLQSAVQVAARQARTGQAQGAAMTVDQFRVIICQNASFVTNCAGDVTVYSNSYASWAALAAGMPGFTNIGLKDDGTPNPNVYKLGAPSCPSTLVATYDWTFIMPWMTYLGNIKGNAARRLVGFAMFETEPYPTTGSTVC